MGTRTSFRPRPVDLNKPLPIVRDLSELDAQEGGNGEKPPELKVRPSGSSSSDRTAGFGTKQRGRPCIGHSDRVNWSSATLFEGKRHAKHLTVLLPSSVTQ